MELLRHRLMVAATQPSSFCTEAKAVTALQQRFGEMSRERARRIALVGLRGAGQEEIGRALYGALPHHGTVRLGDQVLDLTSPHAALRQGILTRFAPVTPRDDRHRRALTGRSRWSLPKPFPGHWYVLAAPVQEADPLVRMELAKDRVRQLLKRYGILFRELLSHERSSLQWGAVFKALRLMELSGEIISGHFFEGIPGLQFMSYEAFRFLSASLPEDAVYWMNACDPASLCGVQIEGLKTRLPSRTPTTCLVYRGASLVLVARRGGRALQFHTPPDDPRLTDYLAFFKTLLGREFNPIKIITVETINGEPALESPYAPALKTFGFTEYHKGLELVRKYT